MGDSNGLTRQQLGGMVEVCGSALKCRSCQSKIYYPKNLEKWCFHVFPKKESHLPGFHFQVPAVCQPLGVVSRMCV